MYSLGYFRFYVILTFIFLIIASVIGIFYPIWEARDLFFKVLTGDTFKEFIEKSFHGSSRAGSRWASCLHLISLTFTAIITYQVLRVLGT